MTGHDGWCPYTCPACDDDYDRVRGQDRPNKALRGTVERRTPPPRRPANPRTAQKGAEPS